MKLEGRTALVTGAGHRLGRAIALALGQSGCRVLVHHRSSRQEAEQTAADIEALGTEAIVLRADLSIPSQIGSLFATVEREFGKLDVLVNSAASFVRQEFASISATDWDAVMEINLRAPFLCTRYALGLFDASSDGRRRVADDGSRAPAAVINIADLSGIKPWRGYAHHGVSKAGLLHLTRAAALEMGPGVRVNAVVPGPILPPPTASADDWARRGERLPLRRTGEPSEIGDAVVFLGRNDFITGQMLVVDGGASLVTGR